MAFDLQSVLMSPMPAAPAVRKAKMFKNFGKPLVQQVPLNNRTNLLPTDDVQKEVRRQRTPTKKVYRLKDIHAKTTESDHFEENDLVMAAQQILQKAIKTLVIDRPEPNLEVLTDDDTDDDEIYIRQRPVVKPKISPPKDPNSEPPADQVISETLTLRVVGANRFVWDGSYLGMVTDLNIIERFEVEGLKYWSISLFGHVEICIIRPILTNSPCISDELKVLFGLSKLGTHRVKYRRKMYILIRTRSTDDGNICLETDLSQIHTKDPVFVGQVQDTYLFRDVLGLTKSTDKSLVLRHPKQRYLAPYPVSFYENMMRPDDTKLIVPATVTDKWFDGVTLNDVARRIFRVEKMEDVQARIIYIQDQLNLIIERVDRDAVWMIRPIIERLTRRMLFGIDDAEKTISEWDWDTVKPITGFRTVDL